MPCLESVVLSRVMDIYFQNGTPLHLTLSIVLRAGQYCVWGQGWGGERREEERRKQYWRGNFILAGSWKCNSIHYWEWAKCNSLALLTTYIFKNESVGVIQESLFGHRAFCLLSISKFSEDMTCYQMGVHFFEEKKKTRMIIYVIIRNIIIM